MAVWVGVTSLRHVTDDADTVGAGHTKLGHSPYNDRLSKHAEGLNGRSGSDGCEAISQINPPPRLGEKATICG